LSKLGIDWEKVGEHFRNMNEAEREELRIRLERGLAEADLSCQELAQMKRFPPGFMEQQF